MLDQAGAIPVMGDAELTVDDVNDWFNARGAKYRLSGNTSMKDLITMYFEEGAAEHVRPELAFAQSILETGSFGHALDNNYGGIGACDSCDGEIVFPTPRDGVRGQIQLLKTFADPSARASELANPPSPAIFGRDPVGGRGELRHLHLQGPHTHLEPHGQRELGDRSHLCVEGARDLLRHDHLRGEAELIAESLQRQNRWVKQRASTVPSTRSR